MFEISANVSTDIFTLPPRSPPIPSPYLCLCFAYNLIPYDSDNFSAGNSFRVCT